MNFRFLTAGIVSVIIALSSVSALAAAEKIVIDGVVAEIPEKMGSIKERDERTFVPIRFVMEHLGCKVEYLEADRTAVITGADCTYIIQEGNTSLFVVPDNASDSAPVLMDTSPYIEETESRMYIPIRFLAEAIGYVVDWNEELQLVTLNISKQD